MELKIGQKVKFNEKGVAKKLTGYIDRIDDDGVLIQVQKNSGMTLHRGGGKYNNERYWWTYSSELEVAADGVQFPVGCRVKDHSGIGLVGTVVEVDGELRKIWTEDAKISIDSANILSLVDEPIKEANKKIAQAMVGYWTYKHKGEKGKGMNKIKELQGTTIKFVDNKIIALDKDGNKGIAKCSPEDEFKVDVGVELALRRLKEQREKTEFKPYIWGGTYFKEFKGYIGEYSGIDDDFGEPLAIGDIVKAKHKDGIVVTEMVFCYPSHGKNCYGVMGLGCIGNDFGSTLRKDLVIAKLPDQTALTTEYCRKILTKEDEEKYVNKK